MGTAADDNMAVPIYKRMVRQQSLGAPPQHQLSTQLLRLQKPLRMLLRYADKQRR